MNTIVVNGMGTKVKVLLDNTNFVSEHTLRAAFLLEKDVPIGLFITIDGEKIFLSRKEAPQNQFYFSLPEGWKTIEFELIWEEARRSRPVTSIDQYSTKPKKPRIEPEAEEQPSIHPEPCFKLPDFWQNIEFFVKSDKAPSRPSTSSDIAGLTNRKRQIMDPEFEPQPVDGDLVSRISPYAWFYVKEDNMKRSAIPVSKNVAITFRHGENKKLVNGDIITLLSYQNQEINVATRVVLINEFLDLIVLQSDTTTELCDKDLLLEAVEPKRGMKYIMMGYSVKYKGTSHISFSAGIIASDMTSRLRYLGSSGSFKGDSGGSCWSVDGRLIGMQVETEKVPHTTDNNGRPASPASGGRCGIIPINKICAFIVEFLPPEVDADWDE